MRFGAFRLLSMVVLARVAVALVVGGGVLRDGQVLRDLWLLPVAGLYGIGVLGLELRGGYGGLARGGVLVAGWAARTGLLNRCPDSLPDSNH